LLLAFGCQKLKPEARMADMSSEAPAASRAQAPPQPGTPTQAAARPPVVQSRKLIRRLDLQLVVRDTEQSAKQLQDLATSLGGFVSDVNANRIEGVLHYEMTLRVPAERLDQAREQIRRIVLRVEREQMSTEDVTDQYVDLDARLRTLQATEAELRELLAESRERARKTEDVMAIYRELTGVRTQIEQIQGQLNALQNLVGLSTIHLTLTPDAVGKPLVAEGWRPGDTVREAFGNLVEFLQAVVDLLIVLVVVGLPVALIVVLPLVLLLKAWKRWEQRRAPRETPS
jgi:hypothetical protein